MENATDALKIAFAMLVFVIAITIIFMLVGQAKSTSDTIMYYTDKTNFYTYKEPSTEKRVSIDQVICSLYNYNKENAHIEIYDAEGTLAATFDLSKEAGMPWLGNDELIKQRISFYIYGEKDEKITINGYEIGFDETYYMNKPLLKMIQDYENDYFVEECYMQYETKSEGSETITTEKLCISYFLKYSI